MPALGRICDKKLRADFVMIAFLSCRKDLLLISNLEMEAPKNNRLMEVLRRKLMGIRLGVVCFLSACL